MCFAVLFMAGVKIEFFTDVIINTDVSITTILVQRLETH